MISPKRLTQLFLLLCMLQINSATVHSAPDSNQPVRIIKRNQTIVPERCEGTKASFKSDAASSVATPEDAIKGGRTPRIFSALGTDQGSTLKAVLAAGDNPNICHAGFSPLMQAVASNHIQDVSILLQAGARPDKPLDKNGGSPMMAALSLEHYTIVQKLLQHGANSLQVTDEGSTTLHALALNTPVPSARAIRLTLAREFIAKGVSVNAATHWGSTPLMLAAASGDIELVSLFLRHGALTTAKDQRGQTAIDIAQQKQHNDILKLLRGAGPKP